MPCPPDYISLRQALKRTLASHCLQNKLSQKLNIFRVHVIANLHLWIMKKTFSQVQLFVFKRWLSILTILAIHYQTSFKGWLVEKVNIENALSDMLQCTTEVNTVFHSYKLHVVTAHFKYICNFWGQDGNKSTILFKRNLRFFQAYCMYCSLLYYKPEDTIHLKASTEKYS